MQIILLQRFLQKFFLDFAVPLSRTSSAVCASLVIVFLMGCIPEATTIKKTTPPVTSTGNINPPPAAPPPNDNPDTATVCPSGSEPARPELRSCCRENNWGKACDGGCWAEGVGEKLSRMCNAGQSSSKGNDCAQSPSKSQTSQWCAFHYNRRYCGVSDADWIQTCKSATAPSQK